MVDLSGFPVLDVVIGLAFVYFLLSIVISALTESVSAVLQLRFRNLRRGLRAREEGRSGPFAQPRAARPVEAPRAEDRIVSVSSFRDPMREVDKLHELYDSVAEARRELGEEMVPFHKFADLIKTQVKKFRDSGSPEVAFRVAVKNGKVNFTARALKGVKS